jgi:HK97 gp10 family phage protein
VDVKIEGLQQIQRKLSAMTGKPGRAAMSSALRSAANQVKNQAVRNAKQLDDPSTPESIWKNITVQSGRYAARGDLLMRVGVKGGSAKYANNARNKRKGRAGKTYQTLGSKSNPGGDTWYWRFLEFGIPSRGIPAKGFLRKAAQTAADRAINVFIDKAPKNLDKVLAKP